MPTANRREQWDLKQTENTFPPSTLCHPHTLPLPKPCQVNQKQCQSWGEAMGYSNKQICRHCGTWILSLTDVYFACHPSSSWHVSQLLSWPSLQTLKPKGSHFIYSFRHLNGMNNKNRNYPSALRNMGNCSLADTLFTLPGLRYWCVDYSFWKSPALWLLLAHVF